MNRIHPCGRLFLPSFSTKRMKIVSRFCPGFSCPLRSMKSLLFNDIEIRWPNRIRPFSARNCCNILSTSLQCPLSAQHFNSIGLFDLNQFWTTLKNLPCPLHSHIGNLLHPQILEDSMVLTLFFCQSLHRQSSQLAFPSGLNLFCRPTVISRLSFWILQNWMIVEFATISQDLVIQLLLKGFRMERLCTPSSGDPKSVIRCPLMKIDRPWLKISSLLSTRCPYTWRSRINRLSRVACTLSLNNPIFSKRGGMRAHVLTFRHLIGSYKWRISEQMIASLLTSKIYLR